jgi:transcriptional regulator with XRE-family HTH domain
MHLADYMRAKKLKDEQVAAKIGRSRPTVSRIRRKLVRPEWDTIKRITAFTKGAVTAADFVDKTEARL